MPVPHARRLSDSESDYSIVIAFKFKLDDSDVAEFKIFFRGPLALARAQWQYPQPT